MGVFATRSPFRPNPIGLSCVKLEKIDWQTPRGPVLWVTGGDLMDGTPIYDIKPYLPFTDSHPEAAAGFADEVKDRELIVQYSQEEYQKIPPEQRQAVLEILKQDPRPSYQKDPQRIYGFVYAQMEIRFKVENEILTIESVTQLPERKS